MAVALWICCLPSAVRCAACRNWGNPRRSCGNYRENQNSMKDIDTYLFPRINIQEKKGNIYGRKAFATSQTPCGRQHWVEKISYDTPLLWDDIFSIFTFQGRMLQSCHTHFYTFGNCSNLMRICAYFFNYHFRLNKRARPGG